MTSTLHRSPSQAKREARRFNVLKAQRRRLLLALERVTQDLVISTGLSEREPGVFEARAAAAEVRSCRVVPLEES